MNAKEEHQWFTIYIEFQMHLTVQSSAMPYSQLKRITEHLANYGIITSLAGTYYL